MANRFWVGGTGTWDNSDTTHWAATSGGAGGQSVPTTGDAVTFDGSSGGGTVSVSSTITGLSLFSLTAGAFTGTLDFSVGNPNITITNNCSFSGSGTRTINMGSGTWTFSGTGTVLAVNTTNLTATYQNASLVFTATTTASRAFDMNGLTFGAVTISDNTSKAPFALSNGTVASLTVGSGTLLTINQLTTVTVTGAFTMTGTSSTPSSIQSSTQANNATISVGSASTITWASIYRITRSGAGTLDATNSFDLASNSSFTSITGPSAGGGGGGQRVISG